VPSVPEPRFYKIRLIVRDFYMGTEVRFRNHARNIIAVASLESRVPRRETRSASKFVARRKTPKALLGERTYEVANLHCNPAPHADLVHQPGRMRWPAEFYAARLGLDARRVLAFALAHAGLSASWDMDDGFDPTYALRCAEVLSELVD
jgi:hypothetical protein